MLFMQSLNGWPQVDLHYNGFCNSVLWQLFHYVPLNTESKLSETKTLQKQWAAYQAANQAFAEAVLKVYRPGDVVWVQDYHLMLLPGILKTRIPDMKVSLLSKFQSTELLLFLASHSHARRLSHHYAACRVCPEAKLAGKIH